MGEVRVNRDKCKQEEEAFNLNKVWFVCGFYILYYLLSSLLFYDYTTPPPRQICVISLTRGNEFRKYWPKVFESKEENATDEWWRGGWGLIDGFNEACKNIYARYL